MPRTYKQDPTRKCYKKYDPEVLAKAVEEVKQMKLSVRGAAKVYDIHYSVIYRHVARPMNPQGGQTALN